VLFGCSLAIAGAVVVILATCGYILISHGIEAKRINDQNIAATRTIVEALGTYRKKNRTYPSSICDLHLVARPRFAEGTQILFKSSADGAKYWLAFFPYREAHLVLPSDDAYQYSSESQRWSVMDINDAQAKYDARWMDGCKE